MLNQDMSTNGQADTTPRKVAIETSFQTLTPIATIQAAFTDITSFQASETSAAPIAATAVIGAATGGRADAPV